ncbi:MAG: glycosyltransferase [Balneolaceae bacterium]
MNKEPLVSVCCITFNHEKFIRDAIESFLMQKTSFPFEIIIHDDASTDGTQEIIKEYSEVDPRIIPILREDNIKSTGVHIFPIASQIARGKYIALCEGDDYWIDPLKLEKQVAFLEENKNFTLVTTLQNNIDIEGSIFGVNKGGTRTMMYPSSIKVQTRFSHLIPHGDNLLKATLNLHGDEHCINEVMAVWRKHDKGIWGGLQGDDSNHILECNRGLTKIGIGLSFIYDGFKIKGLIYLAKAFKNFLNSTGASLDIKHKIMYCIVVISVLFKIR